LGLALFAAIPAAAYTPEAIEVICPPDAMPGASVATLVFHLNQLEIDDDEGDPGSEFEFRISPVVRVSTFDPADIFKYDEKRILCYADNLAWHQNLPLLNLFQGGFAVYPMNKWLVVRNVPRDSLVVLRMELYEQDDTSGDDEGDFNPDGGYPGIEIYLLPGQQQGYTLGAAAFNWPPDLAFGKKKRLFGDGKGIGDFAAGAEFTVTMGDPPVAVAALYSARVDGSLPPKVGGAIPQQPKAPNLPSPGQPVNPAANEPACRDYALKAVEMNVEAQKLGCGFAAPVWSNDHQMHFDWCMQGANATFAQGENASRKVDLDLCRAAAANPQPPVPQPPAPAPLPGLDLCGLYANEAVKAAVTAAVWGCGFSGPRWVQDFGAPYNFCKSNPLPPLVLAEQAIRDSQLQACLAAKGN